jgi:hypothetical protein
MLQLTRLTPTKKPKNLETVSPRTMKPPSYETAREIFEVYKRNLMSRCSRQWDSHFRGEVFPSPRSKIENDNDDEHEKDAVLLIEDS